MLFHVAKFALTEQGGTPEIGLRVDFVVAKSLAEAKKIALAEALNYWQPEQGWSDHQVTVKEVQPEILAQS